MKLTLPLSVILLLLGTTVSLRAIQSRSKKGNQQEKFLLKKLHSREQALI